MQSGRLNTAAKLSIVGAAVLFGTTGTAQELGPESSTPFGVGAVRIVIGAVALWVFARRLPRWTTLRVHWASIVIGAVGVAVYQPAFFTGTSRLGVALGTIVALGSGPVFAGLIEWVNGSRPSKNWALATCLAAAGGTILVFSGTSGAEFDVVGLLGALAAGLGYAVYAVAARRSIRQGMASTEAFAWQFTIAALLLSPFLVSEPLGWVKTSNGIVMALYLGVVATGLAYVLYGWGLRRIDASTATTLTLAEPMTATFAAVVVLDESLGLFGWLGAALVVIGLFIVGKSRPQSTAAALM